MDKIAYDTVLKRPACVLLQAAMGCEPAVAHPFDSRHWLVFPTPDLKVYPLSPGLLEWLVEITEQAHPLSTVDKTIK